MCSVKYAFLLLLRWDCINYCIMPLLYTFNLTICTGDTCKGATCTGATCTGATRTGATCAIVVYKDNKDTFVELCTVLNLYSRHSGTA